MLTRYKWIYACGDIKGQEVEEIVFCVLLHMVAWRSIVAPVAVVALYFAAWHLGETPKVTGY